MSKATKTHTWSEMFTRRKMNFKRVCECFWAKANIITKIVPIFFTLQLVLLSSKLPSLLSLLYIYFTRDCTAKMFTGVKSKYFHVFSSRRFSWERKQSGNVLKVWIFLNYYSKDLHVREFVAVCRVCGTPRLENVFKGRLDFKKR